MRTSLPLVSVLTPTYNRPEMLRRAIEMFKAYSYGNKEMVIVDDSPVPFEQPTDPRILYVRCPRMVLGAKHNLAMAKAQGDILVHQDDDDIFSPARLSVQLEPMFTRGVDLCGIAMNFIRQEADGQFFHFSRRAKFKPSNQTTIPAFAFHDSTSAFTRKVWAAGLQYTNTPVAQKVHLINAALRAGFKAATVANEHGLFTYVRHRVNTWQFSAGNLVPCGAPSYAREPWFRRAMEVTCGT